MIMKIYEKVFIITFNIIIIIIYYYYYSPKGCKKLVT